MGEHVTIDYGHIRIDTAGWVAQRVGDEHTDLTDALRDWGRTQLLDSYPSQDWMTRAELWCMAREYAVCEGFPTYHDHPWLSADVSILLAVADRHAIAIVSVDGHAPTVYADLTTDVGYWYDAGTVHIVCPNEHRWTWRDGELLTDDDEAVNPATVLDHRPQHRQDREQAGWDSGLDDVDLDDAGRIFCPRCDEPYDLRLAEVPRFPQTRRNAVCRQLNNRRPPTDRPHLTNHEEARYRP